MIHNRLKELLKHKRYTQKEFGILLGFSAQQVTDMINGRKTVTPEIALQIEDKLGINPVWLIFGRGEMIEAKMDLGVEKLSNSEKYGTEDADEILKQKEKIKAEIMQEVKELLKNSKNTSE
jgi:plasmid maintenance system antidote protein VapI